MYFGSSKDGGMVADFITWQARGRHFVARCR